MKCPICSVDLTLAERSGIEIDYCPKCRGIWLDRGELDKLIERANDEVRQPAREPRFNDRRNQKKSMIGELFDF